MFAIILKVNIINQKQKFFKIKKKFHSLEKNPEKNINQTLDHFCIPILNSILTRSPTTIKKIPKYEFKESSKI